MAVNLSVGRHQINLFNTFKTDLSNSGSNLESLNDMYFLEIWLNNERSGRKCFKFVMHCPDIEDASLSYSTLCSLIYSFMYSHL